MPAISDVPIIPRQQLFENAAYLNPKLSPDGRWLSWSASVDGVMNVWFAPRDDLSQARPLTRQTERPILELWFARTNAHVLFRKDAAGEEDYHVWCVEVGDGDPRDLTPYADTMAYIAGFHYDDPALVAIAMNDRDARWHDLYAVDIRTGHRRLLYKNVDEIADYVLDSQLGLRLATSTRGKGTGSAILKWDGTAFVEIISVDADDAMSTQPHHMTRPGDAWYMGSSIGRDKCVVLRVDWDTGAEKVVASHAQADISGGIVDPRTGEMTAASANYVQPEWIAIDTGTANDLKRLERDLEATIEIVSQSDDNRFWVAAASRPDQPSVWHLLDRTTGRCGKLFASRPKLADVKLAAMEGNVIKARDGLDLVCYLTLPVTETNSRPAVPLPMVLQVHGGPWWRDSWIFNRQVQWYANRGYAVLQVNYRGSTGFGKAFINAGDREWAGKMHDDLVDAVNWAITEGIADPKRVAICGGSYGGFAAFVGATFTPHLFCCSVPVVGITNLETMLASTPPYWASFYEQQCHRIGDPRTEEGRALLRARSPLHRAGNITKPMLIGHGANDVRCKVAEADQIVAAMREKRIPVIYVVFPNEGHGFYHPANNIAFNAITEEFLARHLGGRFEPVGDDFVGSTHEIRAGAELVAELGIGSPSAS